MPNEASEMKLFFSGTKNSGDVTFKTLFTFEKCFEVRFNK